MSQSGRGTALSISVMCLWRCQFFFGFVCKFPSLAVSLVFRIGSGNWHPVSVRSLLGRLSGDARCNISIIFSSHDCEAK